MCHALDASPERRRAVAPARAAVGVCADGDGLAVDLGFTSFQALNPRSSRRESAQTSNPQPLTLNPQLNAGDLVTLARNGQPAPAPAATEAGLYTYEAVIIRVVQGDTLILKIWLKQNHWLKEKVRLRGIDCPEMDTPEGKAAKRFVETLVKDVESITITTTKPDKWNRYLCDVFLGSPRPSDGRGVRGEGNLNTLAPSGGAGRGEGAAAVQAEELFLNNLLLENGHPRRYDKVALEDWEE